MPTLHMTRQRATQLLAKLGTAEAKADKELAGMLDGAAHVRRNMTRVAKRHAAAIEAGTLKGDDLRAVEDAYMEACRARARCDNAAGIGETLRLGRSV